MAEQKRQTEQPKISDEEKKFNRQINYLVMRKMWQVHCGRAKKGSEGQTIYAAFHMSRERYTRIIRGEAVRFSTRELERLMRETGVRRDIFEGKTVFEFEAISRKDWRKLFDLRGMMGMPIKVPDILTKGLSAEDKEKKEEAFKKAEENKRRKAAKVYENNLYSQMKQSDVDLSKNPDLYYFVVYLKNRKAATDKNIEVDLENMIQRLNSISLAQLEQCGIDTVREYLRELEKQIDIAGTLVRYIELKQ